MLYVSLTSCEVSMRDVCCSFFFSSRRRHTRSYGDWSSDVCSSDLRRRTPAAEVTYEPQAYGGELEVVEAVEGEIGRASCRERVKIAVVDADIKKNHD